METETKPKDEVLIQPTEIKKLRYKDDPALYRKMYYMNNKKKYYDNVKKQNQKFMTCACGSEIVARHVQTHIKSKKHIKFLLINPN